MAGNLREVTRRVGGEDERTALLDDELLAIGYAPSQGPIVPGTPLVLAWPIANARLLDVIEHARTFFFPAYPTQGQLRLEFWLENVFYERAMHIGTPSQDIVDYIHQHKIRPRDQLQLVRYGYDCPAIEWTTDESWQVTQAAAIIEDVRLRAVVPCITPFHAHPGVRIDKETTLLALSEPGQMTGALHLMRPSKVIL